jgi:hypothetical protein
MYVPEMWNHSCIKKRMDVRTQSNDQHRPKNLVKDGVSGERFLVF